MSHRTELVVKEKSFHPFRTDKMSVLFLFRKGTEVIIKQNLCHIKAHKKEYLPRQ